MDPVLCREAIEGEEHVLVFHETVTGLLKLCPVEGKEGIIGNQGLGAIEMWWIFSLALGWTLLGILSRIFMVL